MRWIALLLLIVNGGLIGWQWAGTPGGPETADPIPADIGYLALLREPAEQPQARAEAECFSIGPFADEETASAAGAYLADLGLQPEQRLLVDDETTGYQVMLPPFDTQEEAQTATRELAQAGVQDYFIVSQDGELENAVSLGVFSERRYALDHQNYLAELGFEPTLRLRTRERERFWQDYRDAAGIVTAPQVEARVGAGPLQRLPRDCANIGAE